MKKTIRILCCVLLSPVLLVMFLIVTLVWAFSEKTWDEASDFWIKG